MLRLDAKSATHSLITLAQKIHEELELYQGCKGMTAEIDEAIDQFGAAVKDLEMVHGEAFAE